MDVEACQFNKKGFCRYKTECKKIHISEKRKDLAMCKNIKPFSKRHPRNCKNYNSGKLQIQK